MGIARFGLEEVIRASLGCGRQSWSCSKVRREQPFNMWRLVQRERERETDRQTEKKMCVCMCVREKLGERVGDRKREEGLE